MTPQPTAIFALVAFWAALRLLRHRLAARHPLPPRKQP